MKRLLALLLSLMMVLGMVAVAEEADDAPTALIECLQNIVINVTDAEGNVTPLNLDGLSLFCITDTADTLRFIIQADNTQTDETLAFAVVELAVDKIHLSVNGVDHIYEIPLPDTEMPIPMDAETLTEVVRAMLPVVLESELPVLGPVSLPKADLLSLVGLLGVEPTEANGVTTADFSIPAETISALVAQIVSIGKSLDMPQLKPVLDGLDELQQSGMSLAIEGTISDNGDEQTSSIAIYLADSGETAEAPTLYLNTYSAQDSYTFAVDLPSEDGSYTIAQLTIVTDPAAETIDVGIDFAGMIGVTVNLFKEDGLQCANLGFDAMGSAMSLAMKYGEKDGMDYVSVVGDGGEIGAFSVEATEVVSEDGMHSGDINASARAEDGSITEFTATYYSYLDNYDMGDATLPADIVDIDDADPDELFTALTPLLDYFEDVLGADADAA